MVPMSSGLHIGPICSRYWSSSGGITSDLRFVSTLVRPFLYRKDLDVERCGMGLALGIDGGGYLKDPIWC